MQTYYVYILCSKRNGTLYIGVTNNLQRRVYQHKTKQLHGFTQKYSVDKLIYYESYNSIFNAIKREKQLKKITRELKLKLIEKANPQWIELYAN